MFIKLKLEQHEYDESGNEKETFLEFNKEKTIADVKKSLEGLVNMESAYMELRSLNTTYQDTDKMATLCAKEHKEGASIMLYSWGNYCNQPQFHCFLQLYETQEALMAASMKNRPAPKKNVAASNGSSAQVVINDSDATSATSSSSSENDSTTSMSDSDVSSSSEESTSRKRHKNAKKEVQAKRSSMQTVKMPATVKQYLDEFPCYGGNENAQKPPYGGKPSKDAQIVDRSSANDTDQQLQEQSETPTPIEKFSTEEARADELPTRSPIVNIEKSERLRAERPTSKIAPGMRDFIVLIVGVQGPIEKCNCIAILNVFFEKFHQGVQVSSLSFDDGSAFVLHNGELWIACEDDLTCGWMLENAKRLPAAYHAKRFREHFSLHAYNVVIPKVCRSDDLLEVFKLLEHQNIDVDTSKWAMQSRYRLTVDAEVVCTFCENEVLSLLIDGDSASRLQKCGFRLKYCFWRVEFKAVVAVV